METLLQIVTPSHIMVAIGVISIFTILMILKAHRGKLKEMAAQYQSQTEALRKDHARLSTELRNLSTEKLQTEKALIQSEKLLQDLKAKEEKAGFEIERQKEIARIAASISNEQSKKLVFFTDLAQEFRTPLLEIIELMDRITSGSHGKVSAKLRDPLRIVLLQCHKLLRFTNQFRDISRLQSGKLELKTAKNNLSSFLREIVDAMLWYAQKKEIRLDLEVPQNLEADFDAPKLSEVFYHLLSNAFRFTPEGGRILVSIAEPSVSEKDPDDMIQIRVRNQGAPIPEGRLSNLFDMQVKGDGRGKPRPRMGLSLVKELVNLHGGNIQVRSEPEIGTEFTISIPRRISTTSQLDTSERPAMDFKQRAKIELAALEWDERNQDRSTPDLPPSRSASQGAKILIVEDNDSIRELLRGGFKERYSVSEASNGLEGLQRAREFIPDIIIADIMMPEMDGLDFCRSVKGDESLNHIPVILLTAKASESTRMEGFEAGADAYIAKPFNFDELMEKVNYLTKSR